MKDAQPRHWTIRVAILASYAWLAAFFLLPFLIVLKISFSQTAIAQPPYVPVLDLGEGWEALKQFFAALSFENYATMLSDSLYAWSYWKSIQVAAISTAILLLIGYPVAYALARAPKRWQAILVLLVVLPFWTSFLIRVYAWINILQHDGLLNQALLALRIVDAPVVVAGDRLRGLYRHRLFVFPVHGAAALRRAGEASTTRCSKPRPIWARRRGAPFSP